MEYAHYRRAGWGYGWHFSPFMFLIGAFLFIGLLKSGLFLPLLVIGAVIWATQHRRWHGGCDSGDGEKPKRGFGPMHHGHGPWFGPREWHGPQHHGPFDRRGHSGHHGPFGPHGAPEQAEKPKRAGEDEYV